MVAARQGPGQQRCERPGDSDRTEIGEPEIGGIGIAEIDLGERSKQKHRNGDDEDVTGEPFADLLGQEPAIGHERADRDPIGHYTEIGRRDRREFVRVEPRERLAGALLRGNRKPAAAEDEQASDDLRHPCRVPRSEQRSETEADTDRCESGAHPAREGSLHRHDVAVLGKIGAELRPLRALVGILGGIVLRHGKRT